MGLCVHVGGGWIEACFFISLSTLTIAFQFTSKQRVTSTCVVMNERSAALSEK